VRIKVASSKLTGGNGSDETISRIQLPSIETKFISMSAEDFS
jgi:hypothetical protein